MSSVGAALITAAVVGGGSGVLGWYQHQSLLHVRADLAETRAQLQTANASANAARTQLLGVRRESDEQKIALDQLRAERDSARNLLEAEKQHGERLRAELNATREQLASLARSRPVYPQVRAVEPQILRVAPASVRPQAAGARALQSQKAGPAQ
jgi:septal ring factor EnvC (AmiA/AmiB activator)